MVYPSLKCLILRRLSDFLLPYTPFPNLYESVELADVLGYDIYLTTQKGE